MNSFFLWKNIFCRLEAFLNRFVPLSNIDRYTHGNGKNMLQRQLFILSSFASFNSMSGVIDIPKAPHISNIFHLLKSSILGIQRLIKKLMQFSGLGGKPISDRNFKLKGFTSPKLVRAQPSTALIGF